jgi:hypothetical protein
MFQEPDDIDCTDIARLEVGWLCRVRPLVVEIRRCKYLLFLEKKLPPALGKDHRIEVAQGLSPTFSTGLLILEF